MTRGDAAMPLHKQIRFQVKNGQVDATVEAIREYAAYVRDWTESHGQEWTWATYQDRDDPTRFVSLMWHASAVAEARHRKAEGTRRFAEKLYPHVVENEELVMVPIADSTSGKEED